MCLCRFRSGFSAPCLGGYANSLFQISVACVRRVQGMLGIMTGSTARDALEERGLTHWGVESWTCTRLPSVCPTARELLRDPRLTAYRVRMCELAVEHSPSIMVDPYEAISVRTPHAPSAREHNLTRSSAARLHPDRQGPRPLRGRDRPRSPRGRRPVRRRHDAHQAADSAARGRGPHPDHEPARGLEPRRPRAHPGPVRRFHRREGGDGHPPGAGEPAEVEEEHSRYSAGVPE